MRYFPEGGFSKSYYHCGPSKIVSVDKGGNTFWKHFRFKQQQDHQFEEFLRNLKDTTRPATNPSVNPIVTEAEKREEKRTRFARGTPFYRKATQRVSKVSDNPTQTTYTPWKVRGTSETLQSNGNQQALVERRLNATKTKEILQRNSLHDPHNSVTGTGTLIAARKMQSYIQFITTPTADTPGTALLLHFDDKRYLVGNVHEGTQRACIQRGQKLSKVSDIFLTGKTEWKSTGGLIGMVLTLADATNSAAISAAEKINEKNLRESKRQTRDAGENAQSLGSSKSKKAVALTQQAVQPTLTIHGGPNITHTLATARRFVFRKGMPVDVAEYTDDDHEHAPSQDWKPTWADPRIQVWAMPISPSVTQQASATPSPKSPRKRSFNEFAGREDPPPPLEAANDKVSAEISRFARERQSQNFCKSVVTEMFNSEWRHDNLVETPLRDVQMPAALFTRNPDSKKLERYTGPVPDGTTPMPAINVLVRKPWPGAAINYLPSTKPSSTSMSYIIRNQKQRGRFLPARAKELKVREGPLWSKLTTGHSVQSTDGVTIEPEMVLEEAREGAGVAVIDLPSIDYIDNLVNRSEWKVDKVMTGVGAIIWLLGPGVGQNETLKKFIHEHKDLKHIVSSQDYCQNYLSMDSSAAAAVRLNQLDPSHYAIPVHDDINSLQYRQSQIETDLSVGCIQAQRGHTITTGPSFHIQTADIVPDLNLAAILQEVPRDVLELARAAREAIITESETAGAGVQSLPSQDAEIVFLGTGSALPSKYRNVSATLVRVPGYGSYLLDCGENTLGQLKRVFTPVELAEVFRDLRLIWISHLHADHHLGTVSVIKAWYEEVHRKNDGGNSTRIHSLSQQPQDPVAALRQGNKLFVASHIGMLRWLREYSDVEDYGYHQIVPLNCFAVDTKSTYYSTIEWNSQLVSFHPSNPEM